MQVHMYIKLKSLQKVQEQYNVLNHDHNIQILKNIYVHDDQTSNWL